jgi:hypothetical protein
MNQLAASSSFIQDPNLSWETLVRLWQIFARMREAVCGGKRERA